jgi:chemotaxis protein MotB
MMSSQPPVIVIRKVRKAAHGGHGGAWKVAYADFVTAMMALFLVLWLMASDEKVKKAVGGYFQDPSGVGKMSGSAMTGAGGEGLTIARDDLKSLKEKIERAMKDLPKFEQMKKNVQITVTTEGLRIELLETEKGMFFDSGNALPTDSGREMIHMLAEQLNALPNKLLIEGHTDAKPFNRGDYGNWELSADRANAARRILLEHGLGANRVGQVRGFADQRLRDTKDPTNPANRRISVIVQYLDPLPEKVIASGK